MPEPTTEQMICHIMRDLCNWHLYNSVSGYSPDKNGGWSDRLKSLPRLDISVNAHIRWVWPHLDIQDVRAQLYMLIAFYEKGMTTQEIALALLKATWQIKRKEEG